MEASQTVGSGIRLAVPRGGRGTGAGEWKQAPTSTPLTGSPRWGHSLCTQEGLELLGPQKHLPCARAEGGPACSPVTTPPEQGGSSVGL